MPAHTGKGNTPPRSIRVPEDVWRAARAEAKRRDEPVSEAVVRFLRRYGSTRVEEQPHAAEIDAP